MTNENIEVSSVYLNDKEIDSLWASGFPEEELQQEGGESDNSDLTITDEDLFGSEEFSFDSINENEEDVVEPKEAPVEEEEEMSFDDVEDSENPATVIDEDGYEYLDDDKFNDDVEIYVNEEVGYVTQGELKNNYRAVQQLNQDFEESKARLLEIEEKKQGLEDMLLLAKTEIDMELEAYANVNWNKMAKEDPANYADHKEYYETLLHKKNKTVIATERLRMEAAEKEQEALQQKIAESLIILKRDIPNFSREVANEIINHAIKDLGAPEDWAKNQVDAYVMKGWYNSMLRQKGIKELATKTAPKKVRRGRPIASKQSAQTTGRVSDEKRNNITKKLQSGNFDSQDLGDMFNMLED